MRKRDPGRGERRLEDALEALGRALDSLGSPWMVIGGLAVIARGVRRFTTDIDAVVQGDTVDVNALLKSLARNDIVPRIPDAKAFATANLILLAAHEPSGVELDLSFGWTGFEREALEARSQVAFGPVRIPVASAEDLIIFKVVAARAVDLQDARTLMTLNPAIDLDRIRSRVGELAELMEEPGRLAVLERLLKDVSKDSPRKTTDRKQRSGVRSDVKIAKGRRMPRKTKPSRKRTPP